jgi:hypothetical protein
MVGQHGSLPRLSSFRSRSTLALPVASRRAAAALWVTHKSLPQGCTIVSKGCRVILISVQQTMARLGPCPSLLAPLGIILAWSWEVSWGFVSMRNQEIFHAVHDVLASSKLPSWNHCGGGTHHCGSNRELHLWPDLPEEPQFPLSKPNQT